MYQTCPCWPKDCDALGASEGSWGSAAAQAGSPSTAAPGAGPGVATPTPAREAAFPVRCEWRERRVGPEVLYQRSVSTSHPSLPVCPPVTRLPRVVAAG